MRKPYRTIEDVLRSPWAAMVRAGAKITRQLEIVILPRLGLAPGAVAVLGLAVAEVGAGYQHLRTAALIPAPPPPAIAEHFISH